MAEQYWVGDFFVDLTRNQITQKAESQQIPPKALAVLTCLAKNVNHVVSHDELLSEVWPDTIVTPNTLQRSIAQLRKALGENSQSYIKTHAKQGYSLEVKVRWQDNLSPSVVLNASDAIAASETALPTNEPVEQGIVVEQANHKVSTPSKTAKFFKTGIALIATIAITFVVFKSFLSDEKLPLKFVALNSLTATDDKEYGGIYSPDGDYVVFQRYSADICRNNHLWAQNTQSQQETRLTEYMGAYGGHTFSQDGKTLAFIESNRCDQPVTQKLCYKLLTIDFQSALVKPLSPSTLVECKNSRIISPKWLNSGNIVLMQEFSNRWKLISYSIADNTSKVIHEVDDGSVIFFDYSAKQDLISLNSLHSDGKQYIEILKPDGQLISSNPINLPKEISANRFLYPNFTPYSDLLIFSTGRQLFTMSYQGKINNVSLPLDRSISSPIFHPTKKRMLVTKGHYDSDVASMPLADISLENKKYQLSVLDRSTLGDGKAQFQPNGNLIAFESRRSGIDQVWLYDGESSTQLSNFPLDTFIYEMDWANDGQSLLVNAHKSLYHISLESGKTTRVFEPPIMKFFQWHSEDNTALVLMRIKGLPKFVEIDLNTGLAKVLKDGIVNDALKTDDGQLIYTDAMDRFWQSGAVEDERITVLENQGSDNGILLKGNVLYGVNESFQLWSYTLNTQEFSIIGNVPEKIDFITDINQDSLLVTLRIAAKKEVAEIILAD